MKVCPRCCRSLPLNKFGVRPNGKPQHWCRECHRRYQREYYRLHKEYYSGLIKKRVVENKRIIQDAKSVPCVDCGQSYPHYVMDFDHLPGKTKRFAIASAVTQGRRSKRQVLAEIAKCDVVCANCHRI